MPTSIGELIGKLKLDPSGFSAGITRVKQDASDFAKSIRGVGDNVANFGKDITRMAAPLLALGAAALAASSDVNSGLRIIRVSTGETGADLERLKASFTTVFSSVPASAKDAGTAIATLHQITGATGATLEALATQQLNLARITGSELKPQIEATSQAFNNWKISSEAQAGALDFLFKVSQNTGVSVTTLAQQVSAGGSAARQAGLGFETTAVLVGSLSKAGVDASSVMGGFTLALRKIAQKGGDADPSAVLQAMINAIKNAGSEAQQNAKAVEYFGRSGIQMAEAIRQGRLDIDALVNSVRNSKDTINKAAADTMTFSDSMRVLKNQVELALQPLGKQMMAVMKDLLPMLKDAVGWLAGLAKAFTELDPATQKWVAGLVVAIGMIGPMTTLVGRLTAATALLAGPLGLGLLIAALVLLLRSGDGAAAGLANAWAKMSGDTASASDSMIANIKRVQKALEVALAAYIGFRIAGVQGAIVGAGGAIGAQNAIDERALQDSPEAREARRRTQQQHPNWFGQSAASAAIPNFDGITAKAAAAGMASAQAFAGEWTKPLIKPGDVKIPDLKGGGKKAGSDAGKSFVDAFKDGLAGLVGAVALVDKSDLSALFDKIKGKAKAGAAEIADALKTVTAAINDFAQSQGVNAKVNEAQVANMAEGTRKALEQHTLAYRVAKDEIQRIQVEGLASNKTIFAATQAEIDKMTAGAKAKFAELGGVFKIMPPVMTAFETVTADVTGAASEDIAKFVGSAQIDFDKFRANLEKLTAEAPKPFSALSIAAIDAADNLKKALSGSETLAVINAQLDIRSSINGVIDTLEKYGAQMGLSGAALDKFVEQAIRQMPEFKNANESAVNAAIEAHRKAAIQLPGIWNDVFSTVTSTTKSQVASIFGVLDTIPGKFGDVVRKVQSTVNEWLAFFNSILGLLHKFVNAVPDSVGSALQQVLGLVKQTQAALTSLPVAKNKPGYLDPIGLIPDLGKATSNAQTSTAGIGNAIQKMSDGAKGAFAAAAGAATAFGASLSIVASGGSRSMAILTGGIMSAITGFMASIATTGPIGAIVGGVSFLGSILGSLFGGPSAAEKARIEQQKQLQMQQLKDQVAKDANDIMSGALDNIKKALEIGPLIAEFEGVGKEQIRKVFKFLTRLANGFIEAAKSWNAENLTRAKEAAASLSEVFGAIVNVPAAATAINSTFSVADSQIDLVFNILDRIITRWGVLAEQWIGGASKRIRKVAERLGPAIDLISPLIQAIKDSTNLTEPGDEQFGIIGRTLDKIINMVGSLADKYEKPFLKALQNLSEKVAPALDLWKSDIEAIKASVDLPMLKEADADNAVSGMRLFIDKLIANFSDFNTEGLGRVLAIVQAIGPVGSALKSWAEGSSAVKDYTKIAADTWLNIADDFQRAKDLILFMLASAIDFLPKAIAFEDVMKQIADHLKAGLASLGDGLGAAASAFGAVVNALQGGVPIGGPGGDVGAAAYAPTSFAPSYAGGGAMNYATAGRGATSSGQTTINHFHGTVIHERQFDDTVRQSQTSNSRRRLA